MAMGDGMRESFTRLRDGLDDHARQQHGDLLAQAQPEQKPIFLEGGVQKFGTKDPPPAQEVPKVAPPYQAQTQYQFRPQPAPYQGQVQQQYQYRPQPPLQSQTGRMDALPHIEDFREPNGGYNINGYVQKYGRNMPLISGFKQELVIFNRPLADIMRERQVDEGSLEMDGGDMDVPPIMKDIIRRAFGRSGISFGQVMNNYGQQIFPHKILHKFDLTVPKMVPDGVKLNFPYTELDGGPPRTDTTFTSGELYTDYTIEPGKPHRFFVGVATFELLDHTQRADRLVVIPLNRSYVDRASEIDDMRRWVDSQQKGDDEWGNSCPNFHTMPPHLQNLIKRFCNQPSGTSF